MKRVLPVIILLIFVSGCLGETAERKTAEKVADEPVAYAVESTQIYAEYEANAVAADEKYKDKVLEVTGEVIGIDKDIMDTPYVKLKGDEYEVGGVQCMFGGTEDLAQLAKGQVITVRGVGDGYIMNVMMRGCTIK